MSNAVRLRIHTHQAHYSCHAIRISCWFKEFAVGLWGTSNNCHRSSGAPNLPANDSALFSFRFCAVHPKDVRDCQLWQFFEVPYSLKEAQIVIEQWRKHYNTIRPHSALNYRPPAPQTFAPLAHQLDKIMPMQ